MLLENLVSIEGNDLKNEDLMISFTCAKQIVIGRDLTFGTILSLAAESPEYLREALVDLSKIPAVTGVILLATRTSQ